MDTRSCLSEAGSTLSKRALARNAKSSLRSETIFSNFSQQVMRLQLQQQFGAGWSCAGLGENEMQMELLLWEPAREGTALLALPLLIPNLWDAPGHPRTCRAGREEGSVCFKRSCTAWGCTEQRMSSSPLCKIDAVPISHLPHALPAPSICLFLLLRCAFCTIQELGKNE